VSLCQLGSSKRTNNYSSPIGICQYPSPPTPLPDWERGVGKIANGLGLLYSDPKSVTQVIVQNKIVPIFMFQEELKIVTIGAEILRQPASQEVDFQDPILQELIDKSIAMAVAASGVGIAAPQFGKSWPLFIVASRPTPRYPSAPTMEPTAILYPQIIDRSEELVAGWEGCLSVPGWRGSVDRHRWIEVAYYDRHGERQRRYFNDFVARIFQHEYDHLQGVLFVDRTTNIISEEEYQKIAFDPIE
jgi:peptide deformylase